MLGFSTNVDPLSFLWKIWREGSEGQSEMRFRIGDVWVNCPSTYTEKKGTCLNATPVINAMMVM